MKHSLSLFTLGLLVMAASVVAVVPTLMNYQGRLTDAAGDPVADDVYEVTFRIYDETATQRWIETHNVATTDGLFSVQLGSNGFPLDQFDFRYNETWLGIQVTGDPEMLPRQRLVAVPYAQNVATVDGADGGTLYSDLVVMNNIHLGSSSADGRVNVYQVGTTLPVVKATNFGGHGGSLQLYDENNTVISILEADGDGTGAYMTINGGSGQFLVDGNYNNTGNPLMSVTGTNSATVFNTNLAGDDAVQLPASSVHSDEMFNEPGIASEHTTSSSNLSSIAMTTLQSVTITIPEDGYILVQGKCYFKTYGTSDANYCSFQIDQTNGGGNVFPYVTRAGARTTPTGGDNYFPIFTTRVYQKSAGTHTFHLEGKKDQVIGSATTYHKIVTAMYFPTSYGSVMAMSENAADLPGATPVTALAGEEPGDNKIMYELDLRELEMKALRLRAEAAQAERDLMKAQMQATQSSSQEIE